MLPLLLMATSGCAELGLDASVLEDALGSQRSGDAALSRSQVAAGIREALRVGTARAVATTSRPGGFLEDALLRIALPEDTQRVAQAARAVGLGSEVDALEVAMNRAAERAAGEAKAVFWDAVGRMTLQDALAILNGPDDAATRYFRSATGDALHARFAPVVAQAMQQVGVYRAWASLESRYPAIALLGDPRASLDAHVTQETLDGLFLVLAREERRIREDPTARTTELLRQVFGR